MLAAALVAAIATSCAQDAPEPTIPKKSEVETSAPAEKAAVTDADPVTSLRTAITTLMNKPEHEAQNIAVQHILIGFAGSVGAKPITRTRDEAEALAAKLFRDIQNGADFDGLVKQHTDDAYPGRYPMSTASRRSMVGGFGDVGWRLEVGEVGVAPHDQRKSPFGWHIIKRVE